MRIQNQEYKNDLWIYMNLGVLKQKNMKNNDNFNHIRLLTCYDLFGYFTMSVYENTASRIFWFLAWDWSVEKLVL